jgi:site-specific DNA-methyltransferase (adenine-specific)
VLHVGDCFPWLKSLASNSVDALVTDPPYGIGFGYDHHDDNPAGYIEWLWPIIEECERIVKPGAPLIVWQSGTNTRRLSEWFPREWRLFVAAKNFVQMRKTVMQYAYDPVLVWWKPGAPAWSAGTLSRDFHVAGTTPQERKKHGDIVVGHPCPRPLHQVRHIIEQWVPPGGVVLDPFLGSGTTAIACEQSGRRWLGAEISAEYASLINDRWLRRMLGDA